MCEICIHKFDCDLAIIKTSFISAINVNVNNNVIKLICYQPKIPFFKQKFYYLYIFYIL